MTIGYGWKLVGSMLLLGSSLCGCATNLVYRPDVPGSPSSGGYSEMEFAPDHFQITVSEPRGTSHNKLEKMAMRRSAEISIQQGYLGFRVVRRTFLDHVYVAGDPNGRVRITYLPGYDDWRDYWRMFRIGAGISRVADPVWLITNPNQPAFERDQLYLEIRLSRSLGKDVFEAHRLLEKYGASR